MFSSATTSVSRGWTHLGVSVVVATLRPFCQEFTDTSRRVFDLSTDRPHSRATRGQDRRIQRFHARRWLGPAIKPSNETGQNRDQVTATAAGPTTAPAASGRFVFFRIVGDHGRPHLFQGEVGSSVQPLTIGRREGDQPWLLPDARRMVFHSKRDGDDAVFVRNAEHGVSATRLSGAGEGTPFVTPFPSPRGSHVLFASALSGLSQLWVMRIDGSCRQQLTFDAEPSCFPAWSPDADRIVFVRGDPQGERPSGRLMTMKIAPA